MTRSELFVLKIWTWVYLWRPNWTQMGLPNRIQLYCCMEALYGMILLSFILFMIFMSKCNLMVIFFHLFFYGWCGGTMLRWFESLKLILSGVTRPTRRGALFNNCRPKKKQLSRHYRKVHLSLVLHRFHVSYWMSSAMQRGFEVSGGRVTCSSGITEVMQQSGRTSHLSVSWNWDEIICPCCFSSDRLLSFINLKDHSFLCSQNINGSFSCIYFIWKLEWFYVVWWLSCLSFITDLFYKQNILCR